MSNYIDNKKPAINCSIKNTDVENKYIVGETEWSELKGVPDSIKDIDSTIESLEEELGTRASQSDLDDLSNNTNEGFIAVGETISDIQEELLDKANVSDIPDISNLATKVEVEDGLGTKADTDDLNNLSSTVGGLSSDIDTLTSEVETKADIEALEDLESEVNDLKGFSGVYTSTDW